MATETGDHFSRQAALYAASVNHAADADLDIVAGFAEPGAFDLCLDIATGPGHTAMRIAPRARLVVGFDLAEGMLRTARARAAAQGHENILFQRGDAAALPFADASFDLATCRIAPHHFADIPAFLRETARVLKPAGRLVLEDSLAPDEPALAAFLHDAEVRRDPTHLRSLSRAEWLRAIAAAGLRVSREARFEKRQAFGDWLVRGGLAEPEACAFEAALLAAPASLRDACFDLADGRIAAFRDNKLILRADKPEA